MIYRMKNPNGLGSERFGFSLVEVTLAMGVAAFCLTSLCALLPMGLTSNQDAFEQTTAANITSAIASDLNCAPLASGISPRFGISIPAAGASVSGTSIFLATDGSVVTSGTAVSRYRATVSLSPPQAASSQPFQRTATAVRIQITWPASADPSTGAGAIGSYEANTTLNRN